MYVLGGVESPQDDLTSTRETIPDQFSAQYEFGLYAPGNADHCTTGDVIARTLDGHEIAKFPSPVCEGALLAIDRGIVIINRTGAAVDVGYVVDGLEAIVDTVIVDSESVLKLDLFDTENTTQCTSGDLVVRRRDGRELARFAPPVCEGDRLTIE